MGWGGEVQTDENRNRKGWGTNLVRRQVRGRPALVGRKGGQRSLVSVVVEIHGTPSSSLFIGEAAFLLPWAGGMGAIPFLLAPQTCRLFRHLGRIAGVSLRFSFLSLCRYSFSRLLTLRLPEWAPPPLAPGVPEAGAGATGDYRPSVATASLLAFCAIGSAGVRA